MLLANSGGSRVDVFSEKLAAELTMAAYFVALRHCATSRWLDLQLDLWRGLTAVLAEGRNGAPARREENAVAFHAEDFLAKLAYAAHCIALRHGCRRSFLDLELELYEACRGTVANVSMAPIAGGIRA